MCAPRRPQEYKLALPDLPDYLTCECALQPVRPAAGECTHEHCVAGINFDAVEALLPRLAKLETGHMTSILDGFAAFGDSEDEENTAFSRGPTAMDRQRSDGSSFTQVSGMSGFSGMTFASDASGQRDGYALDYYVNKFKVGDDECEAKAVEVATHYTVALAWVFQYYCHGCPRFVCCAVAVLPFLAHRCWLGVVVVGVLSAGSGSIRSTTPRFCLT